MNTFGDEVSTVKCVYIDKYIVIRLQSANKKTVFLDVVLLDTEFTIVEVAGYSKLY